MKLGFIGTGALTSAIVTGLKSGPGGPVSIVLSPRNADIAAKLAALYPDVRVAPDNQAVLDSCDTILLAVRPQIAHDVLSALSFGRQHHVISLIATLSLEEVAGLTAPARKVTKALPMPMIAHHLGATIVHPADPETTALFSRMAHVVEVDRASEFDALSVVTATYASHFRYLDTIHRWLQDQGVDGQKGRDYIATLFAALAKAPEMAPAESFMDLAKEYATRGGINEQVLDDLTEADVFATFAASLNGVYRRITDH